MEHAYLLVNAGILAAPLALSFDRRVAFYKRWREVLLSISIVSGAYIAWDVFATRAGHWSFNQAYSGAFRIIGLPLGEVLFFVTVPYACLFIYEVVRSYFRPRRSAPRRVSIVIGIAASVPVLVLSFALRSQGYTSAALLSIAMLAIMTSLGDPEMALDRYAWIFLGISYIPFLVVNTALTALPIVEYGGSAIWGVRLGTIPLEDLLYNFGMLGFYLLVYRFFVARRERRNP